jgi:hypothetical protein
MLGRRKREAGVCCGVRYRRRGAPYMVWEVVAGRTGTPTTPGTCPSPRYRIIARWRPSAPSVTAVTTSAAGRSRSLSPCTSHGPPWPNCGAGGGAPNAGPGTYCRSRPGGKWPSGADAERLLAKDSGTASQPGGGDSWIVAAYSSLCVHPSLSPAPAGLFLVR